MRFRYHATRRMALRKITASEVAEALANPTTTYPSRDPGDEARTVVLGVTTAGRRLKIVVVTDDPDTVVTVMDRRSGVT